MSETKKWKKELLKNWNGKCYYTDIQLITDKTQYNHPLYRVIDHKLSVAYGFKNNILPCIIGHLNNLCVCSRYINGRKNFRTEDELKDYLK